MLFPIWGRQVPEKPEKPEKSGGLYQQLIAMGLADPFIKLVVGIVAIGAAVGFVLTEFGGGLKAIIAIGFGIGAGVILLILRALVKDTESNFVRIMGYAASLAITAVFSILVLAVIPVVLTCKPLAYANLLGLCVPPPAPANTPGFTPIQFTGTGTINQTNANYHILVFYRAPRQTDAEKVAGALLWAKFNSSAIDWRNDDLSELGALSNVVLIRTSSHGQAVADNITHLVQSAIAPVDPNTVSISATDLVLNNGDVQVDLF
jgi:hypothetical protein